MDDDDDEDDPDAVNDPLYQIDLKVSSVLNSDASNLCNIKKDKINFILFTAGYVILFTTGYVILFTTR